MSNKGVFFLGFLAFLGVVVYAATRKPKEPSPSTPAVEWTRVGGPSPTEAAAAPLAYAAEGGSGKRILYQNEEKTHIEYNADGLPTDVVIHRTVTQG